MKHDYSILLCAALSAVMLAFAPIAEAGETQTPQRANYARPFEPATRPAFLSLPPGAVEPGGWLRDWCLAARDGFTGADIVIPDAVWRGKSCTELRDYLARRVREALAMCVARLWKDKESVDDSSLFAEVDAAIHEFSTIDYDHSG